MDFLRRKGRDPQRLSSWGEGGGTSFGEEDNLWVNFLLLENGEISAVALAQAQPVIWRGEEVRVGEILLESAFSLSQEVIPLYHQALDYLDEQRCLCALTFTSQPDFFYQRNWVNSASVVLLEKEVLNSFESRFSVRPLERGEEVSLFLQRLFPHLIEHRFPVAKKLPPISLKALWGAFEGEEMVGFCHLIPLNQTVLLCHLTADDDDYNDFLFALEQKAYQKGWKHIYVYTLSHSVPFAYLTALNYQVVENFLESSLQENSQLSSFLDPSWQLLTLGVPLVKDFYYELIGFPFLAPPLTPCILETEKF